MADNNVGEGYPRMEIMLGNEAVARGAYEAGVKFVSSYPGTPSTEITETIAKYDEIDFSQEEGFYHDLLADTRAKYKEIAEREKLKEQRKKEAENE
jgi:TPP-dependent indolepyruvate ferredoxin oxidoreductase alpha subunit